MNFPELVQYGFFSIGNKTGTRSRLQNGTAGFPNGTAGELGGLRGGQCQLGGIVFFLLALSEHPKVYAPSRGTAVAFWAGHRFGGFWGRCSSKHQKVCTEI